MAMWSVVIVPESKSEKNIQILAPLETKTQTIFSIQL